MVSLDGEDAVAGIDELNDVEKRADRINIDATDHGSLFGVGFRDDHAGDFPAAGFNGNGQGSADAANASIERELSDKEAIADVLLRRASICPHDAKSHG